MKRTIATFVGALAGIGAGLLAGAASAQTAIRWDLATPEIDGAGTYTGSVAGIGWTLTVIGSDSAAARFDDPQLLDVEVGVGSASQLAAASPEGRAVVVSLRTAGSSASE